MQNIFAAVKLMVFLCLVPLLIWAGGAGIFWYWKTTPPLRESTLQVEIREGSGLREVSQTLEHAHVIQWPLMFEFYARFSGKGSRIKAGTYEFPAEQLPQEVLDKLIKGQALLTEFSHPPGWNMWQVAQRLHESFPRISEKEWRTQVRASELRKGLPQEAASLEGYLFPDVYRIRPNANSKEILSMMLKNFQKHFTPDIQEAGRKLGLTPHQIVTLASIIEKETGVSEERPHISAVFHNRLHKHMRLQTDPTVIYGIWSRFDGNLHKVDLETYTPYNTYVIDGLPPGPIANPGVEALKAAVFPTPSSDLFFVAKGDGTHYFSASLNEHINAVNKYQIKPTKKK